MVIIGLGATIVNLENAQSTIPPLWDSFFALRASMEGRYQEGISVGFESYDNGIDNPFFYMPGLILKSDTTCPDAGDGISIKRIDAGAYAVFTHRGPTSSLHESFRRIYKEILPSRGLNQRAPFDFEWYDERFDESSTQSEIDIYIPVTMTSTPEQPKALKTEECATLKDDLAGFDAIVDFEGACFQNGKIDGIKDGSASGFYNDGKRSGFLKGMAIGFELSFMKKVAEEHSISVANERQIKRCQNIISKVDAIPSLNSPDIDFDSSVQELRSLYKALATPVGPLKRHALSSTSSAGLVEQTHEW